MSFNLVGLSNWTRLLSKSLSNEAVQNLRTLWDLSQCWHEGSPTPSLLDLKPISKKSEFPWNSHTKQTALAEFQKEQILLWWNFHDLVHMHCRSYGSKKTIKETTCYTNPCFEHIPAIYFAYEHILYKYIGHFAQNWASFTVQGTVEFHPKVHPPRATQLEPSTAGGL